MNVRTFLTFAPKNYLLALEQLRYGVLSRLDYCNSLVFGITDNLLRRLQAVQNSAARLVTGT